MDKLEYIKEQGYHALVRWEDKYAYFFIKPWCGCYLAESFINDDHTTSSAIGLSDCEQTILKDVGHWTNKEQAEEIYKYESGDNEI